MVARPFRHEAETRQLSFEVEHRSAISAAASSPIPSGCSRCSRTCCPTPSSSPSRAACGCNVSAARRRLERRAPGAQPVARGGRVRGLRYRHRHPAGKAEDHLRGVPAGRCQHQPQIWRHRAWAWRSAASCRICSAARSICAAPRAVGSTFTLYLPLQICRALPAGRMSEPISGRAAPHAPSRAGRGGRSARSSRFPTTGSRSSPATRSC